MNVTEIKLTYPDFSGTRNLVAYAEFTVSDEPGLALRIRSAKLMRDATGYFVQMPHEAKTARCPAVGCIGRNATHANFCNWCGFKLNPTNPRGWFIDTASPENRETRDWITAAMVAEHERRAAEVVAGAGVKDIS